MSKYDAIAGNASINARIEFCLDKLHETDIRKFLRIFRSQQASGQIAHTYRELLVGAYLADLSIEARYEKETLGKTPDWTLVNETDEVVGFIDNMTFHQKPAIDNEIANSMRQGQTWAGWLPPNSDRLYQKLQQKAEKYECLANELKVPYVVAVFGEFTASVDRHELDEALLDIHSGGVFSNCLVLSG